jgi:hypothetical protein
MAVSIQLVEGVTGGFMPAIPRKTINIEWDPPTITVTKFLKSTNKNAIDGYEQFTSKDDISEQFVNSLCTNIISSVKYDLINEGRCLWRNLEEAKIFINLIRQLL